MTQHLKVMFHLHLRHRMTLRAEACNGDTDEIFENVSDMAKAWIDSYYQKDGPVPEGHHTPDTGDLDRLMDEFWYLVLLVAKHSPSTSQQQDRLVEFIKSKQDLGALQRDVSPDGPHHSPSEPKEILQAQASDGVIWSDLPRIRAALFEAFIRAPPITPTDQWLNLHTFAAKMTISGVRDLSFYAIWALEDALEVADRRHVMTAKEELVLVPLSERLEPVLAWMKYCAPFLARLSRTGTIPPEQGHDRPDCRWHYTDKPAFVGPLALEAGIDNPGFSMNRYGISHASMMT